MKLYGSFTSPYARKCRIVVNEKSIECEFVEEKPGDSDTRFSQLNPLGKIPVLEVSPELALYDSPIIVEYLDQLAGEPLIPLSGQARWDVQRWHALADGIIDAVVARMIETNRPEQYRMDEAIEKQERKIAAALTVINRATRDREFILGDTYTMADLSIGVAMEYIDFRYPHDWRDRYPELSFWLASVSVRPAFRKTVPPGMENSGRPRH